MKRVAAYVLLLSVASWPTYAQQTVAPRPDEGLREVSIAVDSFARGDPIPRWAFLADLPPAIGNKPFVLRVGETHLHIDATTTTVVRRAMLANEAGALGRLGQIQTQFAPAYQRMHLHYLKVLRGKETQDRTAAVRVQFMQRETGLEQGIYSGVVTAHLLVDDVRVGDTVDYSYSIVGENPVFGGRFAGWTWWDSDDQVDLRRVSLEYPAVRQIAWRLHNDARRPALMPEESTVNGRRRLVFEERAMKAIEFEPYVPSDFFQARSIQFSEYATWNDVAQWAVGLFTQELGDAATLRKVADQLRSKATRAEQASAALAWAQSEIRYFSISLGESSHRPAQPKLVLERRYGDCKDKAFLLVALLNELGIQARPVLVSINARSGHSKLLPTPNAFDHAIVRVTLDGRDFYLDPTRSGQGGRLDQMGQAHEGAEVLVADGRTQGLVRIATPNIQDLVRNLMQEKVTISRLGEPALLEARQTLKGVSAETVRSTLTRMSEAERARMLQGPLERRYLGVRIDGDLKVADDIDSNTLVLTAHFKVPNIAQERNGNWLLRYGASNFHGTFSIPPSAARESALAVYSHPYIARYELDVQWPQSVRVVRDPEVRSVPNRFFEYRINQSFRGNNARIALDLRTLTDQVPASGVGEFLADLRRTDEVDRGFVFVSKSEIRNEGLLGIGGRSFAELLRSRVENSIKEFTTAIDAGRLDGSDLAAAYCERAIARAQLGRYEGAMQDAQQGVKLRPNTSAPIRCRGEVHYMMGELDRSISDYSRALALGATSIQLYYQRGQARFYQGQLAAAAADFRKASLEARDPAEQAYMDLWLIWTLRRLHSPLPEDLRARATAQPKGDWPRPALAMLAGALSVEEMLGEMNRKRGDELDMVQAEGYFYAGQHYMIAGDKAKAREYFEKVRSKEVILYVEHTAAGFELRANASTK